MMKSTLFLAAAFWLSRFADAATLSISSASDWGGTVSGFPASNAIDGSTSWASRWVAEVINGVAVNLVLDLGSNQDVTQVGISWGHGDDYTHTFEIRALASGAPSTVWTQVYSGTSSGTTEGIETYDVTNVEARYIRIKVFSNSDGDSEQMIKEVEIYDNSASPVSSPVSPPSSGQLTISSASDWGGTVSGFPASNAVDGSTSWASRWVAEVINGVAVNLVLDLGSNKDVSSVGIAWGKGDDYSHTFEIRALANGGSSSAWVNVFSGSSSGTTESIEMYDITDMTARYIRVKVFSNSIGDSEQMIKEVEIYGGAASPVSAPVPSPVSSPTPAPVSSPTGGGYGLDPDDPPSDNFDLLGWYLSVPVADNDGYATDVKENALNNGYESEFFYTGSDGAMVFWTPGDGAKTSSGTKYIRTEFREMIRRGDTSIGTNDKANNWAFSSIPSSSQSAFGGIDGEMYATLAVNHVTTTGTSNLKNGRIIIGQIHAKDNEPCRLYYHKLPGNSKGAIYVAHETSKSDGGDETFYNLLGSMVDSEGDVSSTSNPSNGIALNEIFSYSIVVNGNSLVVKIKQGNTQLATKTINMSGSGYNDSSNYMYYKAGIYLQDDTCDDDDYALVSFYELTYSHD